MARMIGCTLRGTIAGHCLGPPTDVADPHVIQRRLVDVTRRIRRGSRDHLRRSNGARLNRSTLLGSPIQLITRSINMTIKVHGHPLSPFVRKVLLTLEVKGVDYENPPVFPGDSSAAFRAISPLGKIPVLQHDDFTTPDSSVICRYLERVFPAKAIYPTDPKLEAKSLWVEEYADTKLIENCAGLFQQRFMFPKMMGRPTDNDVVENILTNGMPPVLEYLESLAPESGYFVGDALSIADIAVTSCFLQAQYGDFAIDGARYPKLGRYVAAAFASPFVTSRMEKERAVLGA